MASAVFAVGCWAFSNSFLYASRIFSSDFLIASFDGNGKRLPAKQTEVHNAAATLNAEKIARMFTFLKMVLKTEPKGGPYFPPAMPKSQSFPATLFYFFPAAIVSTFCANSLVVILLFAQSENPKRFLESFFRRVPDKDEVRSSSLRAPTDIYFDSNNCHKIKAPKNKRKTRFGVRPS
jgi:hypothetical protein